MENGEGDPEIVTIYLRNWDFERHLHSWVRLIACQFIHKHM